LLVDYWFWERGYDVVPFSVDDLRQGKLDDDLRNDPEQTLVYGAVAIVREALKRIGRPAPPNLDFPLSIRNYADRAIFETTMGTIRAWVDSEDSRLPLHIKPRDRQKLFKGVVVESFRDLMPSSGVPDDEPVLAQETVEFDSEWRATILRGEIVNVAHYKGDPLLFPDTVILQSALARFIDRPRAFGMDWGVTSDRRTLLVEVNDGFALGNYGVPGHLYTAVIETRWRELIGLDDNGVGS
jgi:hypothetical protein